MTAKELFHANQIGALGIYPEQLDYYLREFEQNVERIPPAVASLLPNFRKVLQTPDEVQMRVLPSEKVVCAIGYNSCEKTFERYGIGSTPISAFLNAYDLM
jgi:hypothetical protein